MNRPRRARAIAPLCGGIPISTRVSRTSSARIDLARDPDKTALERSAELGEAAADQTLIAVVATRPVQRGSDNPAQP